MQLCDFQKIDPSNNLVYPWYTHDALKEIETWDLKDKHVLEYGAGLSTFWWADKAKAIVSIETNREWFEKIYTKLPPNAQIYLREFNEGDQSKIEEYTNIPTSFVGGDEFKPDIVVVDGILRYECILKALTLPRPLTLIVDNWDQDYVFICPAAETVMKDYEGKFFVQHDHKNHEGKPWKTAIWHLA